MEKIKTYLRSLSRAEWTVYLLSLLFFYINSSYVSYPDEFINLIGGQQINRGFIPYKEYFDHHLPFAWYLGAVLLKFSGYSFVVFRTLWALFQFALLAGVGIWMRKSHKEYYPYYLGFLFLYPLAAVYFWFHLFLADSLAVLFFSATFWILMVQTLSERVSFKAIVVSSLLTFSLLFSSLSYLYMCGVLYLWQVYLLGWNIPVLLRYVAWSAAPYGLYLIYLLLTGSFKDFFFANVTYNTDHYINIPNYTKGRFFNPIKFALTLIFNFHTNYLPLLTKVKHLDLYLPIGVLAGISSFILLWLLSFRNIIVGILFFLLLSFSAPRSNIQTINETDYQMALFLVLGLSCAFFVMSLIREWKVKEVLVHDLMRVAQVVVGVLLLFTALFLFANTYNKYYLRYTQKIPNVNNVAYTADFIDRVLEKGDYYWAGPYEPHEQFFVKNAQAPGKYPSLLPQFSESQELRSSFIEQFEKNPPKIIIFKHEASIFMTPADKFGAFFLEWMKDKYTALEKEKGIVVKQSPSSFNIKGDLYMRNSDKHKILQSLREEGFIE